MRTTARRTVTVGIAALAVVGVALGTSGCSTGGGNSADAPLKVWAIDGNASDYKAKWQAALDEFTKESGIKTELTIYQNDQFKQQIANATGTSTMPDVFVNWSGIGLIGNIYEAGAIAPLDDYYTQYKWSDRFNATALASSEIDGKKMGVPFMVQEMAVVYKKSTLEKAGITTMPTTFAELEDVNAKLKGEGITPWSFAGKNSWDTMRLADSLLETACGAKEFDALRNLKSDWSKSDCATEGFQTFRDWIDKGWLTDNYMALDPNAQDMYKPLIDGTAAFTIDGNWSGPGIEKLGENLDDYAYFGFPTDTDRLSYFTNSLYASSTSKNLDGAAQLIDYLTTASTLEKYPEILNGTLPATNGVTQDTSQPAYNTDWVPLGAEYTGVYGPSDQAFPPDVASAFLLADDQLQLGQLDPKATSDAIQQAAATYKAANG